MRLLFLAVILGAAVAVYVLMFRKPKPVAAGEATTDPVDKTIEALKAVKAKVDEIQSTPEGERIQKIIDEIKQSDLTPAAVKEIMNQAPITQAKATQSVVIVPESFASLPSIPMEILVSKPDPVVNASPLQSILSKKAVVVGISPNSWDAPAVNERLIEYER
jgi:cell division protein YceG involved in septum cleavage